MVNNNQLSALRQVRDDLLISRAEASELLRAGLVQRIDGLLKLTEKGKALLGSAGRVSW